MYESSGSFLNDHMKFDGPCLISNRHCVLSAIIDGSSHIGLLSSSSHHSLLIAFFLCTFIISEMTKKHRALAELASPLAKAETLLYVSYPFRVCLRLFPHCPTPHTCRKVKAAADAHAPLFPLSHMILQTSPLSAAVNQAD